MKKASSFAIATVIVLSIFIAAPAALAQDTEKSLNKVLESKKQKEAYEIRALKINQIEEKLFGATKDQFDAQHQESKVSSYNKDGLITSLTLNYFNPKTRSYDIGERRVYKYDERNNPKSEEIFRPEPKTGSLVSFQKWDYVFDNSDLKQSETLTDTLNSQNLESGMYKYEKKNNTLYQKFVKGTLAETQKRDFDVNNNETVMEKLNGQGAKIEKNVRLYDKAGSMLEKLIYSGDATDPVLRITYNKLENETGRFYSDGKTIIMTYDDAGNMTSEVCTQKELLEYMDIYKYDDLNNMIQKTRFNRNGLEYKLMCKYDETNNRVEEKLYHSSGPGSAELKLAEIVKMTYNDVRRITSKSTYNGEGKPVNKIKFEYESGK